MLANKELGSEFCQSSRLVFGPSQLIHGISQLVPEPSRLMAGLAVSFLDLFPDSSWVGFSLF